MGPASSDRLQEEVDAGRVAPSRAAPESEKSDTLQNTDARAASQGRNLQRRNLLALQRNVGNRAVAALLERSAKRPDTGEQTVGDEQESADADHQQLGEGGLEAGDPHDGTEHDEAERSWNESAGGEMAGSTAAAEVSLQRVPSSQTMAPPATTPAGGGGTAPAMSKEKLQEAATALFQKQVGDPTVDTSATEKQIEEGRKEGEFLTQAGVQNRPALAALVQQTSQPQGPGAGAAPAGPTTTEGGGGGAAPAGAKATGGDGTTTAPAGPTTAPAGPTTAPAGPTTAPAGPTTAPAGPTTTGGTTTAPAGPTTAGPTTAPGGTTTPAGPTTTTGGGGAAAGGAAHAGSSGGGFFSKAWGSVKGFFGFGKKEGEGYENVETSHTVVETAQNLAENTGGELLSEGGKAVVELGGHVLQFVNIFKIMFDARAAYKSHVSAKSLEEIAADIQANHPADQALHEAVTAAAKAKYGEKWERIRKVAISAISLVGGVTLFFTGLTLASNPVGWAVLSAMAAAGLIYLIFRFFRWLLSEDPSKVKRENLAKTVLDSAKSGDSNGKKALEEILEDDAASVLAAYSAGKQKKAIRAVAKHLGE